jgi:DNA gyrase/topoisomerase IV subunit A
MARARPTAPSVSLFPFMSILACLVGTIVVMICILSIIQAQQMGGRPKSEIADAMKFVAAQKELQELQAKMEQLQSQVMHQQEDAEIVKKQQEELEQRMIVLRRRMEAAKDSDKVNRELQKELELLLLQLTALAKEKPEFKKQIEELKKELAARKKDPQELLPKVVVQAGGSGIAQGGNLFFVEATGGAITLYKSKTETKRITSGSIGTDQEYDTFLQAVAAIPNATLVFLIRDDGWGSYTRAAGWAESKFSVKTGKLPIPSKGAIDLGQFERFLAP